MAYSDRMPIIAAEPFEGRRLFASITAGITQTVAINTTTAKTKDFTVTLKAGQAFVAAAGDPGTTSFAPELLLISPTGRTVATVGGDKGALLSTTVSTTGTYTLRVRDSKSDQSGSVKVTAFYTGASTITDSDDAFTAQSGRRFAATIAPGDLDVWTVNAKAGQFLSVFATENIVGSALDPGIILIGPDGKIITTKTSETGIKIDQPSLKTGKYYAIAVESGQNDTGRYGISFAQTPGVQYTGDPDTQAPLVSGTSRTGDLPGGDIDVFQVSATAGKTFKLTLARTTGSLDPEILVVDPTGKIVASANGSTSATLTYKALTSGTFSIITRDREADDGGMYKLTYSLT